MKWNVIIMSNGVLEWYNIFNNHWMNEWALKWLRGEETIEGFWREAKYAFWSKCEYEVLIEEWPICELRSQDGKQSFPNGRGRYRKIDVYQQLKGQKDRVEEYLRGACSEVGKE